VSARGGGGKREVKGGGWGEGEVSTVSWQGGWLGPIEAIISVHYVRD